MLVKVAGSLIVEDLGQELLVCDPRAAQVHHLTGEAHRRLAAVIAEGESVVDDDGVTAGLLAIGVLEIAADGAAADRSLLARRRILLAGAAVAAVGIATLTLPNAAAASSVVDLGGGGGGGGGALLLPTTTSTSSTTTSTTSAPTTTSTTSAPTTTTTTSAPTTTTTTAPATNKPITNGGTINGLGTFVDASGITFTRTATQLQMSIPANWDYVQLGGPTSDRITKVGVTPVGVTNRQSNKLVTIALASSVSYTILIKFNGQSAGSTYLVQAI